MPKKTILVVDDDAAFAGAMRDLLESHGYAVLTAANGTQGVETARNAAPDLVVLDVMMDTDSEGLEVSRRIRRIPELKNLPVIMLTGIRKTKNLPFGFEPDDELLPVCAVLEKPVPPQRLLEEIEKRIRPSR